MLAPLAPNATTETTDSMQKTVKNTTFIPSTTSIGQKQTGFATNLGKVATVRINPIKEEAQATPIIDPVGLAKNPAAGIA